MTADNVKQYFHQWCDKSSLIPQFDVRTVGKFHNSPFYMKLFAEKRCFDSSHPFMYVTASSYIYFEKYSRS